MYDPVPPAGKTEYVTVSPIVGVVFETIHCAVTDCASARAGKLAIGIRNARIYMKINKSVIEKFIQRSKEYLRVK